MALISSALSITTDLQPRKLIDELKQLGSQNIDGGATEANGGASASVGPSVATPLIIIMLLHYVNTSNNGHIIMESEEQY